MKTLTQHLWKLFLFTFPFSLGGVIYESSAYRFGNFNPWVTGVLYLPEFLLFLTFLLWSIDQVRRKREPLKWGKWGILTLFFILFVLNAGVVTFLKGDVVLYLLFLLRLMEAGMIALLIREEVIPHEKTIRWLLFGAFFQVILAFFQTRLNHSVGLHFLGEPHLSATTLNVAKDEVGEGMKVIRGYGTFLHPNILGAYLMTLLFLGFPYFKKVGLPFWMVILVGGIFLSGSRAALLTTILLLILMLVMHFLKEVSSKKILAFGVFGLVIACNIFLLFRSGTMLSSDHSIAERYEQNAIALEMVQEAPWGVGVGDFTLEMERFSSTKLAPWEFQVVHNGYFLTLAELGIQGFLLLVGMIVLMIRHYFKAQTDYSLESKNSVVPFLGLLTIASFDHLLLTSYVGFWLVAIVLSQVSVRV